MPLSSSSTDAQIQAAIDDNASYDESQSVTAARAYRTALRMMIGRVSSRTEQSDQGSSLKANLDGWRQEMNQVQSWLSTYDSDLAGNQIGPEPINLNLQHSRG